jgi:hypothetical protein
MPPQQLKKGVGILKVAKTLGLGTGTAQRIKQEMGAVYRRLRGGILCAAPPTQDNRCNTKILA